MRTALIVLALSTTALAQAKKGGGFDPNRPVPGVDYQKVDAAIKKGLKYLETAESHSSHRDIQDSDELILLTLVDCDLPATHPRVQQLLEKSLEDQMDRTYHVCLLAMSLEELDRVKYQGYIHRCAQFLVDNMCANGQWSYGKPSIFAEDIPTTPGRRAVASGVRPGGTRGTTDQIGISHV